MRTCRICNRRKRRTSFYFSSWGGCKECRRKAERERSRKRSKRLRASARHRYYLRNRERIDANVKKKFAENRAWLNSLKEKPCEDCGRQFPPCAMDWDHRDSATKRYLPSRLKGIKRETAIQELAKCDLVCACCHRIRTEVRRFMKMQTASPKKKLDTPIQIDAFCILKMQKEKLKTVQTWVSALTYKLLMQRAREEGISGAAVMRQLLARKLLGPAKKEKRRR